MLEKIYFFGQESLFYTIKWGLKKNNYKNDWLKSWIPLLLPPRNNYIGIRELKL